MKSAEILVENHRKFFDGGQTIPLSFRMESLKKLKKALIINKLGIYEALKKDLNKSLYEAFETEYGLVMRELNYAMSHLEAWAKPQKKMTSIINFPGLNYIFKEPYGVVLIISPWNYPFQLTINPLISAIAAGNCMVVKPSNYSPATSEVIAKIIRETFEERYVSVVLGGRDQNRDLLDQRFDYIFFTGGKEVGIKVLKAAAEHLTPVTLELGGKSPVIVDNTANLKIAAQRLIWGKTLNAGQTCVAPDYLYIQRDVKDEFIKYLKKYIIKYYTEDAQNQDYYPKIINEKHFNRLKGLMASGGDLVFGGKANETTMQISPTLIDNINRDMPIMQEEIFGPLLPIMTFDDINDVIKDLKTQPKPLALYLFTSNNATKKKFMENVSFGGGCINESVGHMITPYLPFGGVGESGMGSYHGKNGYDTFTHQKGVLKKSTIWEPFVRNPPLNDFKLVLLKFFQSF